MNQQKIFTNDQVDISSLPSTDTVIYLPLQASYLKLKVISTLILTVFLILATWIPLLYADVPDWLPMAGIGFWILLALIQLLFVVKSFPHMAYALRLRDIIYKKGWLYKRQTTIPFSRIQHVDVRQGVLERAYRLGKLNIYTAGGQGSDLSIPGLDYEEAQRLKSYILGTLMRDEEE